jgi:hypothetical protein
MNSQAVIVVLCALSLGATAYLVASTPRAGDDRVADLERRLEAAEKRADAVASLRGEFRDVVDRLDRRVADVARSDAPQTVPVPERAAPAGADAGAAKSMEDAIAERVEKRVAEKMDAIAGRDRERGDDGKWKAPIDDLAAELKLSGAQTEQARRIFDHARDEVFTLLKTQRLDGGSLLDDFADALKSGVDPADATKQFFSRVVSEKVPGTAGTYLAEFLSLNKDVDDALGRQLEAAQMKRLRALRVDVLDVKTGYDPVGDYVRAKVQ